MAKEKISFEESVKRLDEIVVRAGVQPDDLVVLAAAGRGENDGKL